MKLFQAFGKRSESLTLNELLGSLQFNGLNYPVLPQQTLGQTVEEIGADYSGLAASAYMRSTPVFTCMSIRQLLFQEATFKYRRIEEGRPGQYFATRDLQPLERPAGNTTTGDLLARSILDVDLAGNWYVVRSGNQLHRLHPEYVYIVLGSKLMPDNAAVAPDAEVIGYAYKPPTGDRVLYLPEEVAHFAPYPDPLANFRGMSWLTPVIREVMADQAAMTHKLKFFEQGASVNMVVKFDPGLGQKEVEEWIGALEERIGGAANAYRTLYLGGGADVQPIGSDMREVAFAETVGQGETRIAAAAGVPSVIAGFSEGLKGSSLNAGNFTAARRRLNDLTMRPLWRNMADSLESIIRVPPRARLWVDDRDIPALGEDQKDSAETLAANMQAIKAGTEAGYEPDSVVDAVTAGDLKRLEHTGVFSVQLQPPGSGESESESSPEPAQESQNAVRTRSLASDAAPKGEEELRAIVSRFEDADSQVRSLLAEAITGDREALKQRALKEIKALRSERLEDAVQLAYESAYDSAVEDIEAASRRNPSADSLAESLQEKLSAGLDKAEDRADQAFDEVNAENLAEKGQDATTALVDDAGKRWSLGAYAAMLAHTLGRRATSRGIKDAAAGGTVRFSTHANSSKICAPYQGKEFPATSAPEPPLHEGCKHMLEPLG